MVAIFSSETSVETQRATRLYISQDDIACRFLLNYFFHPEDGGALLSGHLQKRVIYEVQLT
jgi:hypothetical protein